MVTPPPPSSQFSDPNLHFAHSHPNFIPNLRSHSCYSSANMTCIKGVARSASVALAPDAPYMAAGTMAGAVDLSFSSSANLEIFKLDFQSDDRDLPLVGEIPSSERFNRLAWGKIGSGSEEFSLGLIAGGLVDGNIDLWNPLSLIGSQSSAKALVGHLSVHKGPVRGLEFNPITPNRLASGADDGEICIWDFEKPSEPSHFPLLKGSGSATQDEISFISWNRKVQQILASTSNNGTTVIWDLRKQKPIINFADSVRRRCSVLQWNPDIATQIMVASDEDGSDTLKLWDMRNTMSPVREFTGHQKGVIAMEWCPSDSSYLLTCAKDNRTICWDTNTAEIVAELPAGNNWNFDVHWYPKIPGVILASSFDGKIGVYNIEGCSRYDAEENNFGTVPLRAPKWYKRPVGASFGFGGKLVSFHTKAPPKGVSSITSEIFLNSLVTEQSLVIRTSEFEAAIENGDMTSLRDLCEKKSEETESEEEKETWGLLNIMFEEEGTSRNKLISHLGFSLPIEENDQAVNALTSDLNALGLENTAVHTLEPEDNNEAAAYAMDNGEDFFDNLPAKPDTPVSTSAKEFMPPDTDVAKAEETQAMPEEEEESSDPLFDDAIQRALVVGDYKEAVDQCMVANKMADALVIAHVGGKELWESTREKYLKMSSSPYMKVVSAMVNDDLRSLIYTRSLKFWKETLALLCTFAQGEQWSTLCDALASKLMAAGNTLAAVLCYICAGNVDRTVEIWSRSLANERDGRSYAELLQDLMEKTLVLALATGNKRFSASLCKLFENYAEILASQGLLTTAMKYLKVLDSGGSSPELSILRDRISQSAEPETKIAASGNTQPQSSMAYNQELSQAQQNILTNPYDNQYQQPYSDSYIRGYTPPASNPPMQQSTMFMPHQAQPAPQPSFTPAPAINAQPSMRTTFVPSTLPALKNAGQYQQLTANSHSFPGPSNNAYPPGPGTYAPSAPSQGGKFPNLKMPQVVALGPIGFTPMANPGVVPRSVQPASHPSQQTAAQAAPTPAAPPATVQTADTSNVPAHQKPVIVTLTRLFNETSEALGGARANPAKKREIEDNSRKLGALFVKLNSGDISKNAADKLAQLCQALDNQDFSAALQIQILLTTSEWDECNFWLATLKRMIKARQNVR